MTATLYLDCRTKDKGGAVASVATLYESDGLAPGPHGLTPRSLSASEQTADVVLATHGFNVSREGGITGLAALRRDLNLPPRTLFIGVLWPGDFWIPFINYPSEASDAVQCGKLVAAFVNANLTSASSISLVSHSLGARVVLEATRLINRRVQELCVTAAAADDDCLAGQYDAARRNAERTSVLCSVKDGVLQLAYPVGDFGSDVFWRDNDSPWRGALGLHGPRKPDKPEKVYPFPIPKTDHYGHLDYFPAGGAHVPGAKSERPVQFIHERLTGQPSAWPPIA